MSRRRRESLGVRCLRGFATPAALAAVAFGIAGGWHVLEWLVGR